MGQITIYLGGSFIPNQRKDFTAVNGGHAQAVAEAIAWLAGTVLREAIILDHRIQAEGDFPDRGFGGSVTRVGFSADEARTIRERSQVAHGGASPVAGAQGGT